MTTQPKAPASLAEALAALQAQMPVVAKHGKANAGTFSYAYAPGEDITPKVYPLMSALGLSFTASPTVASGEFRLAYWLKHVSGESIGGEYPLPDPARLGPQDLGKAITYARRYALCALIGLFPGGDDTDATADGKPIDTPARTARPSSSAPRKTGRAGAAHERLRAQTLSGDRPADRTPPQNGGHRHVDERTGEITDWSSDQPEDRPGSIMPGQHRAIEMMLGMLGFKPAERADRHAHAALRLGLDQLPAHPGNAAKEPSMTGLSAAQAAELIRALQDDLDDLKKAEADA